MGAQQGQKSYVIAGILTLMLSSLMDNMRGPLVPVLCDLFKLPLKYGGLFLTSGNIAAVIALLTMGKTLRVYTDKRVTIGVYMAGVLPGILAPFLEGVSLFVVLGLSMGGATATMGSICNLLTLKGATEAMKGRIMSFQQVMYGVGSFCAPIFLSAILAQALPWWSVLVTMSAINLVMLFVWSKVLPEDKASHQDKQTKVEFSPTAILTIAMFICYVVSEVLASMWMTTYLNRVAGWDQSQSSKFFGFFFLTLGASRFASFFFITPKRERPVMIFCLLGGLTAILAGTQGAYWCLPLAGILGPFFPLVLTQISRAFPTQWKDMTVLMFVGVHATLGVMNLGIGHLADLIGLDRAYYLSPFMLIVTIFLTIYFMKAFPEEHTSQIVSPIPKRA